MNITRISLVILVLGLIVSFSGISFAQTPDGSTPSEETGCDGLLGAAFGLCNAYCEALDCNSNVGYNQHPTACDKVLGNYQKKTNYPGPPCSCRSICQDELDECQADCGTDLECQSQCCLDSKNCQNDCCDQAKAQNQVLVDRCVKNCKGDEECIVECTKGIACAINICSVQGPR